MASDNHPMLTEGSSALVVDRTTPLPSNCPTPSSTSETITAGVTASAEPHVTLTVTEDAQAPNAPPSVEDEPWILQQLGATSDAVQLPILYQSVAYAVALILVMFGLCMVLNVVTWRYPDPSTQLQLPDIMLDSLPDIPQLEHVTDGILTALVIICFVIIGGIWAVSTGRMAPANPAVYDRLFVRGSHPFSASMPCLLPWIRFFVCYTAISLLRIVVLTATVLPATNNQCRVRPSTGDFWANAVRGVLTFGSGNVHCGDLLFSGHAAVITLAVCSIWTYGPVVHRWLRPVAILAMVSSWFTIFASRSHYTDDVVIATYISLTLWALVPHNPSRGSPVVIQLLIQWPCRWLGQRPGL